MRSQGNGNNMDLSSGLASNLQQSQAAMGGNAAHGCPDFVGNASAIGHSGGAVPSATDDIIKL